MQALREVERERSREKLQDAKGTDVHYLKNVVLKLYETGISIAGHLHLAVVNRHSCLAEHSTWHVA